MACRYNCSNSESLNYKIKFDCEANRFCLRHTSQFFTRELVNSENQNVPTLVDDKVKLFILDKTYSENRNVLPNGIDPSINNDNSENVEASYVTEIIKPVNNQPITLFIFHLFIHQFFPHYLLFYLHCIELGRFL